MNKTIYLNDKKNEKKLADLVKGKCRTIMYQHTNDETVKVNIFGIGLKDWVKISPDIMKLVVKDRRAAI